MAEGNKERQCLFYERNKNNPTFKEKRRQKAKHVVIQSNNVLKEKVKKQVRERARRCRALKNIGERNSIEN